MKDLRDHNTALPRGNEAKLIADKRECEHVKHKTTPSLTNSRIRNTAACTYLTWVFGAPSNSRPRTMMYWPGSSVELQLPGLRIQKNEQQTVRCFHTKAPQRQASLRHGRCSTSKHATKRRVGPRAITLPRWREAAEDGGFRAFSHLGQVHRRRRCEKARMLLRLQKRTQNKKKKKSRHERESTEGR